MRAWPRFRQQTRLSRLGDQPRLKTRLRSLLTPIKEGRAVSRTAVLFPIVFPVLTVLGWGRRCRPWLVRTSTTSSSPSPACPRSASSRCRRTASTIPRDYQDANLNILTSERLERVPYSCQLPNVRITLKGWCRQRVNSQEVPCVRNLGPGVGREQIAVFINDEILPIPDPPVSSVERRHWLEVTDRTHLVEIVRDNQAPQVNVLHCRTPESYPLRYGGAPARLGSRTRSARRSVTPPRTDESRARARRRPNLKTCEFDALWRTMYTSMYDTSAHGARSTRSDSESRYAGG